jgi:hypothetical protein
MALIGRGVGVAGGGAESAADTASWQNADVLGLLLGLVGNGAG